MILIGSWFFKYPDFIDSNIEITTTNPPADIIAKANGKLVHIFISDNEFVSLGAVLAVIENPAEYTDVLKLSSQLEAFSHQSLKIDSVIISDGNMNEGLTLGELQVHFSRFLTAYSEFLNFRSLAIYKKKIESLKQQYKNQQLFYNRSWQQQLTLEKDFELSKKEHERFEALFQDQTIPEAEYEKIKSKFLLKQYTLEGAKTNLANIQIQISQLENNILDLQLQQEQMKNQLLQNLEENYDNLLGQIDIWEDKYLLKSPIDGNCTFTKYWNINQNVTSGEKVMTIIPNGKPDIIGKLLLPIQGSGKVKTGQKVNVKLQNYPYMEYGMVSGFVKKISLVPSDSYYYVEVVFPSGLKTNYGEELKFSQSLQGSAEIITNEMRLLHRLIQPIRSIWKERVQKQN
ncbi:MAG: HlyD family efflux transporter periplasmic adaptor subunit [Bacteroidales bacterium]